MTNFLSGAMMSQFPTKENVAFTRYADEIKDDSIREKLQFPRGEPFRHIDPSKELFRVQKTDDHWQQVSRSKAFLANDFFPPRAVPLESNLQELFSNLEITEAELEQGLLDTIPRLNHDMVVELALYLSLESKYNSKAVWNAIEAASYESLHLFNIKQICQL